VPYLKGKYLIKTTLQKEKTMFCVFIAKENPFGVLTSLSDFFVT